jgi:hypothetical protein
LPLFLPFNCAHRLPCFIAVLLNDDYSQCSFPDDLCVGNNLRSYTGASCNSGTCSPTYSDVPCPYGCVSAAGDDYCDESPDAATECCFYDECRYLLDCYSCSDDFCPAGEVCEDHDYMSNFGYCIPGPPPPNNVYQQIVDSGAVALACSNSGYTTMNAQLETNECTVSVMLTSVGLDDESNGIRATSPNGPYT